jgi:hypothetical protein
MDSKKLIHLIEGTLAEANVYSSNHVSGQSAVADTKKVLLLLNEEIKNNSANVNVRILRAMHNIGMSAYKDFENTKLEDAIDKVTTMLYNEVPPYRTLEPLRTGFGKGDPI